MTTISYVHGKWKGGAAPVPIKGKFSFSTTGLHIMSLYSCHNMILSKKKKVSEAGKLILVDLVVYSISVLLFYGTVDIFELTKTKLQSYVNYGNSLLLMLLMISIYLFMHLGDSFDEYLVKCQQNYERYAIRQNRAEGKKALKD